MIYSFSNERSDIEQEKSPLRLHNPESHDIVYANRQAVEIINLSGADLTVFPRTNDGQYDEVWEEEPDPTYKNGVPIKGYFVPQPLATQLAMWGTDIPNQTTVMFARQTVEEKFGKRMVREGDIIELPYNSSVKKLDRYRVLNVADSGNFKYTWLYLNCLVENITDDITIDVGHR